MNVFEEFQSAPNELLTDAQIRKKEKMAAVVNDYNDLKEKYGDNKLFTINRVCIADRSLSTCNGSANDGNCSMHAV